jgi:hypothetical protein
LLVIGRGARNAACNPYAHDRLFASFVDLFNTTLAVPARGVGVHGDSPQAIEPNDDLVFEGIEIAVFVAGSSGVRPWRHTAAMHESEGNTHRAFSTHLFAGGEELLAGSRHGHVEPRFEGWPLRLGSGAG